MNVDLIKANFQTFRPFVQDISQYLYEEINQNKIRPQNDYDRRLYAQIYCGIRDLLQYEKTKNT